MEKRRDDCAVVVLSRGEGRDLAPKGGVASGSPPVTGKKMGLISAGKDVDVWWGFEDMLLQR